MRNKKNIKMFDFQNASELFRCRKNISYKNYEIADGF